MRVRFSGREATQVRASLKELDQLLLNRRMQEMRQDLHRAALSRFRTVCPAVIVADWCTLMRDGSLQLLRAALLVGGQTLPVWGEVHKDKKLSNAPIHKRFLVRLRGSDVHIIESAPRQVLFQRHDIIGLQCEGSAIACVVHDSAP